MTFHPFGYRKGCSPAAHLLDRIGPLPIPHLLSHLWALHREVTVPFVFCSNGSEITVDIVEMCDGATVSDLAIALDDLASGPRDKIHGSLTDHELTCAVDGVPARPSLALCKWVVVRGSAVTVVAAVAPSGSPSCGVNGPDPASEPAEGNDARVVTELRVVGGLHAGRTMPLRLGSTHLGRSTPLDSSTATSRAVSAAGTMAAPVTVAAQPPMMRVGHDPTVSRRHAEVIVCADGKSAKARVTIRDLGSTNGTLLDGEWCRTARQIDAHLVRMGATICALGNPDDEDETRLPPPFAPGGHHLPGNWTHPFNRSPRRLSDPSGHAIAPPTPPNGQGTTARLGMVALVAPLAMGLVMVIVLHSVMWALFALLSPVMMLGSFWDQRRQGRRLALSGQRRFAAELAAFEQALRAAVTAEGRVRRQRCGDPVSLSRRARLPGRRLWERRPDQPEWMWLSLGIGDTAWIPPLSTSIDGLDPRARDVLVSAAVLRDTPIEVALTNGEVVGIVGHHDTALSLLRSLVTQAVVHHGPADLRVACLVAEHHEVQWAAWLPHLTGSTGAPRIAVGARAADELVGDLIDEPTPSELLVIVTDPTLFVGRRAAARRLLGPDGPATGAIVMADRLDQLPARCGTIVELDDTHGTATASGRSMSAPIDGFHLTGVDVGYATRVALDLARLDDSDVCDKEPTLPTTIRLVDLIGLDTAGGREALAATIGTRWIENRDGAPRLMIGVGPDGPIDIDLSDDGPHVLVAGTTGSGKSELLRTLVTGLAVGASPADLTFLLIDFKGGSAFDCLGQLPHAVGLVTDLSPSLAQRTVRCLLAEVRLREQWLRDAGVGDLAEYRARQRAAALPADGEARTTTAHDATRLSRLVVVVDEFATLARDLPDVLDALVSIAQRGRSLGIHLILATQRPAGVVSDHIKANVGLRLAMRLHDPTDSVDVIGCDQAARLPRRRPGRMVARFGPDEMTSLQVATVSLPARRGTRRAVTLTGCPPLDRACSTPQNDQAARPESPTDLTELVEAIKVAQLRSGDADPHPVCPPPLPDLLAIDELDGFGLHSDTLMVALADLPDEQSVKPVGWTLSKGILLLVGVPGSGTTTALVSLCLATATADPADVHLYAIDGADRGLAPVAPLPHVGAVIEAGGRERQRRVIGRLARELQRRRSGMRVPADSPSILLLIDDFTSFSAYWDDPLDQVMRDLSTLALEGTALGIHLAVAADRLTSFPTAWHSACARRWCFRLTDSADVAVTTGVDLTDVRRPPGRVFDIDHAHELHVASAGPDVPGAVARRMSELGDVTRSAPGVEVLRRSIPLGDLPPSIRDESGLVVSVGVGFDSLAPTGWTLHAGDHLVITGPPRSGRSTALATIAQVLDAGSNNGHCLCLVTVSPRAHRRQPPVWRRALTAESDLAAVVAGHLRADREVIVLIDDADRIADDGHGLAELLAAGSPRLHVIAALSNDAARSSYGHFTRMMRTRRQGLLLQPDIDIDGDLFGIRLPRRSPIEISPGRGYLVADGHFELIAVAEGS